MEIKWNTVKYWDSKYLSDTPTKKVKSLDKLNSGLIRSIPMKSCHRCGHKLFTVHYRADADMVVCEGCEDVTARRHYGTRRDFKGFF